MIKRGYSFVTLAAKFLEPDILSGRVAKTASEMIRIFQRPYRIRWGRRKIGDYVKWQQLYESCAFERNLEKLNKLVFETEDAIYLRSRELSKESHIANEVQALSEASKRLLEIKIKKLGWSHPAKVNAKS